MTIIKEIKTEEDLQEMIVDISDTEFITLDTEFISQNSYVPELMLIQLCASKNKAYILDPVTFSEITTKALEYVVNLKEKTVVIHDATQDLQILYNQMNQVPEIIFDSQLAANFCGLQSPSYEKLVKKYLNLKIDKSEQRSNWYRRPLSGKQLKYASQDVTYLYELYPKLIAELKQKESLDYYLEDQEERKKTEFWKPLSPSNTWKRINYRDLDEDSLKRLISLAQWREKHAQQINRPSRSIFKDGILKRIAKDPPTNRNWWNLPENQRLRKYRSQIDKAIKQSQEITGIESLSETHGHSKSFLNKNKSSVYELLLVLRAYLSEKDNIASQALVTNDNLKVIALGLEPESLNGWRKKYFMPYVNDLMSGKIAFHIKNNKVEMFRID